MNAAATARNGYDKHATQRRNVLRQIERHIEELQRSRSIGEIVIKLTMLRGGVIADEADIEYTGKYRFKQIVTKDEETHPGATAGR